MITELERLCQQIENTVPHCLEARISYGFGEPQLLRVKIKADMWDKEAVLYMRDEDGEFFSNEQNWDEIIETIKQEVAFWKEIGPPYKIEYTEKRYKAHFTPGQIEKIRQYEYG